MGADMCRPQQPLGLQVSPGPEERTVSPRTDQLRTRTDQLPVENHEVEVEYVSVTSETVIEFMTDIEGSWEYFLRFVHHSEVLFWSGEELGAWGPGLLSMRSNGMLVFGGDAPDKGSGDIRIVRTFINLKKRFPSQVHIVLGNRDILKLRFFAELQQVEEADKIWIPPWSPGIQTFDAFINERKLDRDLIAKLKWLLHCTMGCQDTTFGTRLHELALLNGRAKDDDVLQSYRNSVDPTGKDPWMLDFIKMGKLGIILDDTLFVHGGIQDESIGVVPGLEGTFDSVHKWVAALNAWKDLQIAAYEAHPMFYEQNGELARGGTELINYVTPLGGKSTVVYVNPFEDGNPVLRSEKVRQFLRQSSINRVVSGHQPHGQAPAVVRHPDTDLLCISADTSRSDGSASKLFNPADNRGSAISIVRIQGTAVIIEGQLADGRKHRCQIHTDSAQDAMPDALVGRQLDDGSWVKTVFKPDDASSSEGPLLLTALGKGFTVNVADIPVHTVCLQLREEFRKDKFHVSLRNFKAASRVSVTGPLQCLDSILDNCVKQVRDFTLNKEEFHSADNYIFSMGGVVLDPSTDTRGRAIVEKINKLIQAGKGVMFITNNSNYSRNGLTKDLNKTYKIDVKPADGFGSPSGLPPTPKTPSSYSFRNKSFSDLVGDTHIVTSANTCAWFLREKGIKRPYVICSSGALLEELEQFDIKAYVATVDKRGKQKAEYLEEVTPERVCGLISKHPDVDAIVVGWDQHFTALKAAVATQYVKWAEESGRDMPIISCSMDPSGILGMTKPDFCTGQGFQNRKIRAVGNGSMTNTILNSIDCLDKVIDVGKPSILLLEQLKRPCSEGGLGLDFSKTVVVGSTLNTDIELANGGGMKSLLVLSGVTNRDEAEREMNPLRIPTWIVDSFADI